MPATLTICLDEPIGLIRPELYGHFAEHLGGCVYGGLWVGEKSSIPHDRGLRLDVLAALQRLHVPVLRWPGGCFADDYHWEDGIGPPAQRPRRFNAWWGHDVEDNAFGTHEFIRLCRLIGAKPYLAGNVGSGSVREMKDWVEYCNFPGETTLARRRRDNGAAEAFGVEYWGVGNESWGCGGSMCPEDAAGLFKRFSTYLGTFTRPPTRMPLTLIACGPNGNDTDWTRRFFKKAGMPGGVGGCDWYLHGFAAHFYAGTAGAATEFDTDQWYTLLHRSLKVEQLILDQRAVLDEFDPQRKIPLLIDEWGTWHPATPGTAANHLWQQNTLRDALVAALTLNVFNNHADKLLMCNIAQVVNVLQAMILTDGDRMLLTPTYHVFDLMQSHQGGTAVRVVNNARPVKFALGDEMATLPGLQASASTRGGKLTLTVVNPHATLPVEADVVLQSAGPGRWTARSLTAADLTAHNTFDQPDAVTPTDDVPLPAGSPPRHTFPPASVTVLHCQR